MAAPATYSIGGEQYLAVMVGYGGAAALFTAWALPNQPRLPGRLLVFTLSGTATVAPYPKPAPVTIDLSTAKPAGEAAAGLPLYNAFCMACHGANASGHYLPDLQTSPAILSSEAFKAVVIDGARSAKGMVSFSKFLNADQVESVRAYILSEARKSQAAASKATGR